MALILNQVPGYSDLPDAVLAADLPAFALHVGEISNNAALGMVRMEIFQGLYLDGETVTLPTSPVDGYNYSRDELLYFGTIKNSCSAQRGGNNPLVLTDPGGNITSTGWISPASDGMSLWFTNYNVQQYDPSQLPSSEWNQDAGKVYVEQWYAESSGQTDNPVFRGVEKTNDGVMLVWTIAQRGKNKLVAASSPLWAEVDETQIATDKPYRTDLLQQLLGNSKFCCLNTEVFYVGEYVNGETISLGAAVSQVDGYQYSFDDDIKFMVDWRWTASGNAYVQPPYPQGQMGPFFCSISPTGAVTIWVDFIHISGRLQQYPDFGRISAFAFCTRKGGPVSLPLADQFREIDNNFFVPGETVRASTLLAIKKNADQAVLTPEFFGPTIYADLDIIPLPVSPIDGYEYSRQELHYIWRWRDTTNQVGEHLRLPLYAGNINQSTGVVHLQMFRLPPGSPWVSDNNTLCRITVLVAGFRGAELPELVDVPVIPPTDLPIPVTDQLLGSVSDDVIEITAPAGAENGWTAAHGLGYTPEWAKIEHETGGNAWFEGTRYDGTNLYLKASAEGVKFKVFLFRPGHGPSLEVDLAPSSDGNFIVAHTLGAEPAMVLVQMNSGGNIWSQAVPADVSHLNLVSSGADVTGKAALWLGLTGLGSGSVKRKTIGLSANTDGNFQVAHGLGFAPTDVFLRMNSPGFPAFWFQDGLMWDDVFIYLVSPGGSTAAPITGSAELLYSA